MTATFITALALLLLSPPPFDQAALSPPPPGLLQQHTPAPDSAPQPLAWKRVGSALEMKA